MDPAHVYQDDGISGAEFERRAGLTALLAALRPRPAFDAVWYYLDDRRAAMDSALAKVMASLSGFAPESEREQARARTYDALARKAKAGYVAGRLVYGYENVRVDGHVERRIHEPEAAAVRRIFELYASGTGLRTIAKTLTAGGGAAADTPAARPTPRMGTGRPSGDSPA